MTFMPGEMYREVYSTYIPRLCVDVIVCHATLGVALIKRQIPPVGWWHLPGGIVYRGERLSEAASRIAQQDLVRILSFRHVGVVESGEMDHQVEIDNRQVPMKVYAVMIEMMAETGDGFLRSTEQSGWFTHVPITSCDPWQMRFLQEKGFLK